jgi:hypothetical protein
VFKRFTLGVGVGYILGARAGQKRYEQIADLAERAMELPWVGRLTEGGRNLAEDQGRRLLTGLRDRARWNSEESGEEDEDSEDDVQGAYDDEDEGAYDEQDDQGDDEDQEEEMDDAYDQDSFDGDGEDEPDDSEDGGGSGARRAVKSVVSAARQRGRVA